MIPYLRTLPAAERDGLAKHCSFRTLERGASVFTEGDPPEGVFLIVVGRIKLVRSSSKGREQILHEEGAGVTLAEVPVFDGRGYVGSAVAVEEALVFFVPRSPLLKALKHSPGSALEVIHILASRVRTLAGVVEDLSLRGVTERLAAYLCREAERAGGEVVELRVTRDELATHLGTVREQASRALSELNAAGLIEIKGRRIVIVQPAALRRRGSLASAGTSRSGRRRAPAPRLRRVSNA